MYCIACGRQMRDEERFCSQCGTRRAVIPTAAEVVSPPPPPARPEEPVAPEPTAVRPIRSTAEIMPIRVQRPTTPPPVVTEAAKIEPEAPAHVEPVAPWPTDERATPSLFNAPEPPSVSGPEPVRAAVPPPPVYATAPQTAATSPTVERYAAVPFADTPGAHEVGGERRKVSPVLIGAIVVAVIALVGIVWMLSSTMIGRGKAAATVEITIYPMAPKVVVGKSVDFVATVTGAPASDVTWSVEEGENAGEIKTRGTSPKGDTISLYSTYTPPKTPGTYHLVATSTADTTKSATAEITVTAK